LNQSVPVSSLAEDDNGKELKVPVGAQIRLDLSENPTTGYRWTLNDFKDGTLALRSDRYIPNQNMGMGSGGIRQFLFEVTSGGKTEICLKNMRQWEGEKPAAKTFNVTVIGENK
jgi:inhibitor of cysteine peptidase